MLISFCININDINISESHPHAQQFLFNSINFLQIKEFAMDIKCTPAYENIFMVVHTKSGNEQ